MTILLRCVELLITHPTHHPHESHPDEELVQVGEDVCLEEREGGEEGVKEEGEEGGEQEGAEGQEAGERRS